MKKRTLIIGGAVVAACILLVIIMVARTNNSVAPAQPIAKPIPVPWDHYVAGAGIIEAGSEDINVATLVSGVVVELYVDVGDEVNEGDPLFRLDSRDLQAQLRLDQAQLEVARRKVSVASADLDDKLAQLELIENLTDKRAISVQEADRRRYAVRTSRAELYSAQAEVETAQARVDATRTDIERLIVTSPIEGTVLQVDVRPGEYVKADETAKSPMVLGVTEELHVRVDIDETDAWRLTPGQPAVAVPRGNPYLQIPLEFLYIEPYIIPKRSLTGDTSERVDTRVLQVIYSFERDSWPVYVGQQVDVYIRTPNGEEE